MAPFGGKGTYSLATMQYNKFVRKLSLPRLYRQNVCPNRICYQSSLSQSILPGHGLGRKRGGYGSEDIRHVDPARLSAPPTYVNDECCSRQSIENHTLQLFHCLQTPRCSCRRYGLPCSTVYGPCQIDECDKPYNRFLPEELEDDDE